MSRINARSRLFGNMRAFFDAELFGVFTWDQVATLPGEEAARDSRGRRNPLGNFREVAGIRFSDYEMVIKSPEDVGPLGEVVLIYPGGDVERGPIDSQTWQRLGGIIRERELTKVKGHGERKRQSAFG